MTERKAKKNQFSKGSEQKKGSGKSNFMKYVLASLVAIAVLSAGFIYSQRQSGKGGAGPQVSASESYDDKTIEMTDISADLKDGKITVPLKEVKAKKIVYFEYKGSQTIPLLAYVSPSGKLVAAVSMCEPCKSTRFHIEDNNLVCNACGTTWNIDTLEGISGGCLEYPPDLLSNTEITKDRIIIDENEVAGWKPRV